jgi:hypothetical protein
MAKALFDVLGWIALMVGLVLAALIAQTVVAYLRHDTAVPCSFI